MGRVFLLVLVLVLALAFAFGVWAERWVASRPAASLEMGSGSSLHGPITMHGVEVKVLPCATGIEISGVTLEGDWSTAPLITTQECLTGSIEESVK